MLRIGWGTPFRAPFKKEKRSLLCNDSQEPFDFAQGRLEACSCGSFDYVPFGHFAQDGINKKAYRAKRNYPILTSSRWGTLVFLFENLVGLQLFDRQADLEAGGSGFGLDAYVAAMFADGPLYAV